MNALALSLSPSIFSKNPFLRKGLLWTREGILKERMKANKGREGVKPISMLTLWNIDWFFKQQIELLLINCLAVTKSFIKKTYTFFKTFFVSQHVNIFIVVIMDIYLCKKHCRILCRVYKKKIFSPFSLLNFSFKNS